MRKEKVIENINPLILKGIAHRGLHNQELTENGLKAFQNAREHQLAFELDIHLTKDGELVVCHDSELMRTTGKKGIIEDLTLEQIKKDYRLLDGEQIPSFQEVLQANAEQVPIVVELKVYQKNYVPLAKKACEELKMIKDKRNIMLISFDPRALLHMKKSGFIRSLLVTLDNHHQWTYHLRFLFESLDLDYRFVNEKRAQRYQKRHFVNVWTIDSKEKMDLVLPYTDTVTFQLMDEAYVNACLEKKNEKYLG
ncbi:MAG: hypothetical protein LKJ88_07700 [Bacilli bacterium]|jgi:glycerophosphoryl diester phosphodiesterase|nr:hypothetical protein [Bacilli bacterium]